MAQKELRRMSRVELIEIIYALEQNEEELKQQNSELQKKLEERTVITENAGSIAEAVAGLNHIFDTAQQTADDYLASVQKMKENAEQEAKEIIRSAKRQAEEIIRSAEQQAEEIVRQARQEAEKASRQAGDEAETNQ